MVRVNKKDILALDNEKLLALFVITDEKCYNESKKHGSVREELNNDYMMTLEEVSKRFNLDMEKLHQSIGFARLFSNKIY